MDLKSIIMKLKREVPAVADSDAFAELEAAAGDADAAEGMPEDEASMFDDMSMPEDESEAPAPAPAAKGRPKY
jgi:hypothetical protein